MNYTTLSLEAAAKRFSLINFAFFNDRNNKHKVVKIAENDAELVELRLDILPNDNTIAYIFTGNLTVSGAVWNEETDSGIALIALKNVSAKNVAVGGQDIYIEGNLSVEELICGSCNNGIMTVKGNVKAQYILNDDYTFLFEKNIDAIILKDIKSGYYKINNWKESLDNYAFTDAQNLEYWDVLNPLVYNVYHNSFEFSQLIKLLKTGEKLFVNNKEKLKQLNFRVNNLTELFSILGLTIANNRFTFGFAAREIDINFQFWRHFEETYYLNIGLEKERFIYEIKENVWAINYPVNSVSNFLTKENDFKNYYRAALILIKSKTIVQDFINKKDKILKATQQLIAPIFTAEFPFIYKALIDIYETPNHYNSENKSYFDDLKINYMHWSFQQHALLHILQKNDLAIVVNGKEYISTALNELTNWFKKRGFDVETDWKTRGLYLKRRIEYFSKDVLIVNDICKEKNIPLSILDFSVWLNDRFIVFFPIKNSDKEVFLEWLNETELIR